MILVLRREAEADIRKAFLWYESKRPGLGGAFVNVVDGAFERLVEAPSSFPLAYRDLRRLVLGGFRTSYISGWSRTLSRCSA